MGGHHGNCEPEVHHQQQPHYIPMPYPIKQIQQVQVPVKEQVPIYVRVPIQIPYPIPVREIQTVQIPMPYPMTQPASTSHYHHQYDHYHNYHSHSNSYNNNQHYIDNNEAKNEANSYGGVSGTRTINQLPSPVAGYTAPGQYQNPSQSQYQNTPQKNPYQNQFQSFNPPTFSQSYSASLNSQSSVGYDGSSSSSSAAGASDYY